MAKVTESGKFAVPGPYDMLMEWWLQMYPKRRTMEMKNFVAVYLKTENTFLVRALFTLNVVNGLGKKDCIYRGCEESAPLSLSTVRLVLYWETQSSSMGKGSRTPTVEG